MAKVKIIFLLASISQPRCIKRINSFMKKGFDIEVYGFNRGVYTENLENNDFFINDLGYAPSGSGYFKKILDVKRKLSNIFDKNIDKNVIYYAFSFDIVMVCKLFSKKQYIYEISDLVYTYFSQSLVVDCFKCIDKRLIKNSMLTVLTSAGYAQYLFANKQPSNVIIQPNRLHIDITKSEKIDKSYDIANLTFAYIGAFRYPDTVFRFAKVVGERYPNHQFYFWGDSNNTELKNLAQAYAAQYANVEYFGPFTNPADLSVIYSKVDIVVACYDTTALNERVAEPNKFYESLYFQKPIVVSKNTFLSDRVDSFDCGFSINANNDKDICAFLNTLTVSEIRSKKRNIGKIDLSEVIDDDGEEILNFIRAKI